MVSGCFLNDLHKQAGGEGGYCLPPLRRAATVFLPQTSFFFFAYFSFQRLSGAFPTALASCTRVLLGGGHTVSSARRAQQCSVCQLLLFRSVRAGVPPAEGKVQCPLEAAWVAGRFSPSHCLAKGKYKDTGREGGPMGRLSQHAAISVEAAKGGR